ncbi:hypothetical protein BDM02DRAFT_3123271 [Thelephora ganbajun]|uniref:Uncharacterized protein n=1 Tax=Thelephora ganbajun TaxID=370292 RepID=A0ACB6Z362_THEGA|nr:hypothetical protein BDM02DRAFT_3123271 [Thelephora ganbajun]
MGLHWSLGWHLLPALHLLLAVGIGSTSWQLQKINGAYLAEVFTPFLRRKGSGPTTVTGVNQMDPLPAKIGATPLVLLLVGTLCQKREGAGV